MDCSLSLCICLATKLFRIGWEIEMDGIGGPARRDIQIMYVQTKLFHFTKVALDFDWTAKIIDYTRGPPPPPSLLCFIYLVRNRILAHRSLVVNFAFYHYIQYVWLLCVCYVWYSVSNAIRCVDVMRCPGAPARTRLSEFDNMSTIFGMIDRPM